MRENPALRVYVHEKGAPHMVDPSKLIASATRLWGDEMDRLWGEMRPVPAENLVVLRGGERIAAGGRDLDVAYTPGHASHHVSYFSGDTGIAFVGDTAGVRLQAGRFIMPPTPPPDIDLEAWRDSFARIAAWHPETLFLTHFGPFAPVAAHLTEMADHLEHDERAGQGVAGAAGHRRGSRGVVHRRDPARAAPPDERVRRAGVRGGRTVRSELARAGEVLEKEEQLESANRNLECALEFRIPTSDS